MLTKYKFPHNTVVHCVTSEDFENVLSEMSTYERVNKWSKYGAASCIDLINLTFGSVEHYVRNGYDTLTMSEFKKEIQRRKELKIK